MLDWLADNLALIMFVTMFFVIFCGYPVAFVMGGMALLFGLLMQWLGLYVASFLLVAGFMTFIGRIAAWKSLLTALLFSLIMFVTFDIGFNVIMPKGPLEALFGR